MIICPICDNLMIEAFTAKVLKKYDAKYDFCPKCGYLKARHPCWLEEAYSDPIADADTGLIYRNTVISRKIASVLYWTLLERGSGTYADFAGGYGVLTRMMRDYGFNFFWQDKFCENKLAIGFEYSNKFGPCKGIVATEVLEHLENPLAYIEEILNESQSQILFFTTELFIGSPPDINDWYYYSFSTGQHIGFFQKKTLLIMAEKLDLYFYSYKGIHILSKVALNSFMLRFSTNKWVVRFSSWLIPKLLGTKIMSDYHFISRK